MKLWVRLFWIWVCSFFRPRLRLPEEQSELDLRVWINDLDTNLHMNNGRFLTIMDLGRLDMLLRSPLVDVMMKNKAVPILSSATIRYRLSLDPLKPFKLTTRIIWWDEKWAYIEQRFILTSGDKAGAVAAIALVKGNFYSKSRAEILPIDEVMHAIHPERIEPGPCPQHLKAWLDSENALRDVTRMDRNEEDLV